MFHSPKKHGNKAAPKTQLTQILSPKIILAETKRIECIQHIYEQSKLIPSRINLCVQPLLEEIASNCQQLPSQQHPFYVATGGLIDYALYRTKAAMILFKQIVLPNETSELSETQARTAYVLLSASLLRGMGTVITDHALNIYNAKSQYLGTWQPLWERLIDTGQYYHAQQLNNLEDELRVHLTPLIAKAWMPQTGLAWIAEDHAALLTWLQLLQEEHEGLRILEAILKRAEAMAWQEMAEFSMAMYPIDINTPEHRIRTFTESPLPEHDHQLFVIGLQFIKWLNQKLAQGQMLINQTPIVALEHGLNISPEAFKWFLQHHPQFRNWRLIQQAVMTLGIHDKEALSKQGLIINKIGHVLPKEVIVKQMHNQQHIKTNSLILESQWQPYVQGKKLDEDMLSKKLNSKGEWISIADKSEQALSYKNV